MELWFVLAFIPAIFRALNNTFDKVAVEKFFPHAYSYKFYHSLLAPLILFFLFYIGKFEYIKLSYVLLVLALSLFYMGGTIFYTKALKKGEASSVVPLFSFTVLFSLLYDITLFHESLHFLSFVGIGFIFLGVIFLFGKQFSLKINSTLGWMLLSCFSYSLFILLSKYFLLEYDFSLLIFYQTFFDICILGGMLFIPHFRKQIISVYKKNLHHKSMYPFILLNQSFDYIALFTLQYVLTLGVMSYIVAIGQTQYFFVLLFTTLLSLFYPKILQETFSKKILFEKFIAILCMALGVIILQVYG